MGRGTGPAGGERRWGEAGDREGGAGGAESGGGRERSGAGASGMRGGPAAGLAAVDAILDRGELKDYRLAHAARAEFCRRLGRTAEARTSFERALALTRQEPERRFLERRLAEIGP